MSRLKTRFRGRKLLKNLRRRESQTRGQQKNRRGRPPDPAVRSYSGWWSFFDCGASTAAPGANIIACGASPLSSQSAEEAGSRPFCGLVLCNFLLFQVGSLYEGSRTPLSQGALRKEQPASLLSPPSLCTRRGGLSSRRRIIFQDAWVRYRQLRIVAPLAYARPRLPGRGHRLHNLSRPLRESGRKQRLGELSAGRMLCIIK